MKAHGSRPEDDPRIGYFLVQARRDHGFRLPRVSGVLEDLATGQKWSFDSIEDLGVFLTAWGATTDEARR